ncbi:hypothetical protein [Bacillus sp. JCM 19034]|uniref:hypothetical protein n=1 Tax=Bacillus sp. JCM 19034 TaxID=1481928 RepID=UPI0007862E1C|nr:hypothetical protein [Bacillus sp. JCM 19034]
MKIELCYYDLVEEKYIFPTPINSTEVLFIPIEGDTLLVDGWGYIVGKREFHYENDATKITVFCTRERKRR